jgi:hypothetical protein
MHNDDTPGPMPLNPHVTGCCRLPAPRDDTPGIEAVEAMDGVRAGDEYREVRVRG